MYNFLSISKFLATLKVGSIVSLLLLFFIADFALFSLVPTFLSVMLPIYIFGSYLESRFCLVGDFTGLFG